VRVHAGRRALTLAGAAARRRATRPAGFACAALAAALACAGSPDAGPGDTRGAELEAAIAGLSPAVEPAEARALARRALAAADSLALRYRPIEPPLLGNLAFHLGLRERALCCHWVEDLFRELDELPLRSLELHWGVAHHGSHMREHSSVIAVPAGGALRDGLVLDAWRHAGRLYWVRVEADRYPWRLHPADADRRGLGCRS
jgi:hypothetical protein